MIDEGRIYVILFGKVKGKRSRKRERKSGNIWQKVQKQMRDDRLMDSDQIRSDNLDFFDGGASSFFFFKRKKFIIMW